jgi:hypothetical protein
MFTAQFWGRRDIPNLRRVLGLCLILALSASLIFFVLARLFPLSSATAPMLLRVPAHLSGERTIAPFQAGTPVAERLPKSRALSLLAGALLPTGCGPDRCFDLLLGVAERARAVRLTYSDSGEAARELAALAG